jgi:DNA uptake protein and related DNA-binding proteins
MTAFKRYVKEFLVFTKWEQRGILFLVVLLVSFMAFALFYKPSSSIETTPDISTKIQNFERQVLISEEYSSTCQKKGWHSFSNNFKSQISSIALFKFDPNKATLEEFQALGFSLKQSQSLLNYRAKGGRFRTKEDFKKSFVVSELQYRQLAAYIVIPTTANDTVKRRIAQTVFQLVDLNNADTTRLGTLRGVGSAIAQRIVDYRKRLGGFVRNEQLLEVYGIDSSKYLQLRNQLKSPSKCSKICVNTVDVEILKKHPYLSSYEARNIVYFRIKKGPIRNLQQLVSDRIISKSTSEKLSEYIDYSN